jgi:hypothetical protein
MAENPFNQGGLGDLGLLKHVDADVLGSPNKVQDLQNQLIALQTSLGGPSEAPPSQINPVEAAIKGAIAGSRGTFVDPLTGEESAAPPSGGFGQGLLAGLDAGVQGAQADALNQYEAKQKAASDAADHREKISAGIRMVLAQNPLAFEALGATPEGQRLLGQLAYGVDIPVDPTAKAREADDTLSRKQRINYYIQVAKSATDPGKRAEALRAAQDLVDPNGELSVSAEDMVAGKVPSYSEMGKLYGDEGLRLLSDYNMDHDQQKFFTGISKLKAKTADSLPATVRIKLDLAQKLARIKREYSDANDGKEMLTAAAIKQLPEEDQLLAEQYLKQTGDKTPPFSRYVDILARAWDDQPLETRQDNPVQAEVDASNLAVHRINSANKIAARVAGTTPVAKPEPGAKPMAIPAWQAAVVARARKDGSDIATANKAIVAEYIQQNKAGQIPPAARKKAGL